MEVVIQTDRATAATFGHYGHYRGAALVAAAARPLLYAGAKACDECHSDTGELVAKDRHKGISCESCHGPGRTHSRNPDIVPAKLNDQLKNVQGQLTQAVEARLSTEKELVSAREQFKGVSASIPEQVASAKKPLEETVAKLSAQNKELEVVLQQKTDALTRDIVARDALLKEKVGQVAALTRRLGHLSLRIDGLMATDEVTVSAASVTCSPTKASR